MNAVKSPTIEDELFFSELVHQHKLINGNVQAIQSNAFRMLA